MSNNDDKDRWETFCKLYDKLSSKEEMRELFEEEIKCFSLYLSHVNQDYVYNATFLPQFNDDFWNFLCAFNKKYKIVEELFDAAKKYYNVTLKIDRYWMMTVDEKGNIKKSTLSGVDYICEKEMMIECSILYNLKRYTFRRNEMIIFGDESLKKVHEDLKAFLEKHSSKDKEEEKSQKRDSGNEDAIEKDEDDTQKFEKRLTRYYRFFEYRKQRLVAMHQPENGSDEDYKKELEKIIYSELSEEDMEDDEKILQAFMNSYGADIWDAAIGMYQTFADDKEQNVLKNYILKINELCYGKASVEFSYLECTYRDLLRNEEENDYSVEEDIFEETLKRYMTEEDLMIN